MLKLQVSALQAGLLPSIPKHQHGRGRSLHPKAANSRRAQSGGKAEKPGQPGTTRPRVAETCGHNAVILSPAIRTLWFSEVSVRSPFPDLLCLFIAVTVNVFISAVCNALVVGAAPRPSFMRDLWFRVMDIPPIDFHSRYRKILKIICSELLEGGGSSLCLTSTLLRYDGFLALERAGHG